MRILITGSNGQLGSELRQLQARLPHAHTFFNSSRSELDITSEAAVNEFIERESIDLVVNCCAYTAVDKAETERELAEQLNHTAPRLLATAMERSGGSMIHLSTDYVFDGRAHRPYRVDDATNPQSVYGRTKLRGEEAVMQACSRAAVVRTSWLYSAFGNNFVKTMLRLGRERDELGVVTDQIGSPTYAADLAHALWLMMEKGVQAGVYHYGNEGVASWYDLACAAHRMAGISCAVRPIRTEDYPLPAPRPHYSVLDKSALRKAYQLDIPWWEDSLARCLSVLESPTK